MTAPLMVTADAELRGELLRLAAAAGVAPDHASDAASALRAWSAAPLVLVGADLADEVARVGPARREGVFVVAVDGVPDRLFPLALAIGAEGVAELPRSEGWLIERLTDVLDTGRARGLVIGVVGGSGGAGATTLACALAQTAGRSGPSVVVDADPWGPGVDRVLGLDLADGIRWDALCQTTGRLSARSLRDSLPRRDGVAALTWYAGPRGSLQAFAAREALSAARRGHDTVVVDLGRRADDLVLELAARCDRVLVVVHPSVPGVASAVRTCAAYEPVSLRSLVVRGAGLDDATVARLVGVPVLTRMPDQRGLAEAIDLGLGPIRSRRGPLGRACAEILGELATPAVAA